MAPVRFIECAPMLVDSTAAANPSAVRKSLAQLFGPQWPQSPQATRRLWQSRLVFGLGFLAAAVACAVALPAGHGFAAAAPAAGILFVLSARLYLRATSTGWTGCQQAAFVLLAFSVPLNLVPLAAFAGVALAQPRRQNRVLEVLSAASSNWYAIATAVLLSVLAPGSASWHHWLAYVIAFGGQIAFSIVAAALRDLTGGERALGSSEALDVLLIDASLTPIGLAAAVAASTQPLAALVIIAGATIVLGLTNYEHWQRREQTERALRDPLTGLANRALLDEAGATCQARCRRAGADAAVLLIDLDDFKPINDTFGHQAGDDVLRAFAHHLRSATRAVDIAARLGGDEFALVLSEPIDTAGAHRVAETLRRKLAQPLVLADGQEIMLTFSIGCAGFGSNASLAEALAQADAALYADKRFRKR